jgi:hypothetical protein
VAGSGGSAGSATGGQSSNDPAPIWSFTQDSEPYVDPTTLVTSDNRVYVASYGYPVRVIALDGAGKQVFSTDVGDVVGVAPNSGPMDAALAVAHDDTLVAVVRAAGTVVRLDAQGKVRWSAANKLFGDGAGKLSAPALAKDGTIYVAQNFGAASNYPLPRLLAIDTNGAVTAIVISSNAERGDANIAPAATAPHLLPNGQIRLVVGAMVRTYQPGTLDLAEEHPLATTKPYQVSPALTPRLDGGFATTAADTSMLVPGCDGQGFATFGQAFDAAGAITWTTALPAQEVLTGPTSDKNGAWLYSWGNCLDGQGAGTYRVGGDGKLLHTFNLSDGSDALQSFGTSGAEVLTLQETTTIDGVKASPIVTATDRETGAITRRFALHCAMGDDAANEEGAFRLLPNGRLIVTCAPAESAPGKGGVYAFDTSIDVPTDSAWPFPDGDLRSRRSFETGTAGSGAGGSVAGGAGGGSGSSAGGTAGAGGSGTAGSGGDSPPTSCAQTNQVAGCCSADGKTLYYCSVGVVKQQTCAAASCGWNDIDNYYDCDTDGLEAPDGTPPIACGL